MNKLTCLTLAVAAASIFCSDARAAQSFDTCTGFIDALPATISTQGTWCLRDNLSTSISSGNAITIAANNVTIDCNEYKLGGLGAGTMTDTVGIRAEDRSNITIRNCNIRGFQRGTWLLWGAGHVIEDNRFENNRSEAIRTREADNTVVRRNQIIDTGGRDDIYDVKAILLDGGLDCAISDNIVAGVVAAPSQSVANRMASGIISYCEGSDIRRNQVSGLQFLGDSNADGIHVGLDLARVEDNFIHYNGPVNPYGSAIYDEYSRAVSCRNNTVVGFNRQPYYETSCTADESNSFVEPAAP